MCPGILTVLGLIAFGLAVAYLEIPLLIRVMIRDSTDRKEEEFKAIHKEQGEIYMPCFLCKNLKHPEHGDSYCKAILGSEIIRVDGVVFSNYIELHEAKKVCNVLLTTKYERSWFKSLLTVLGA